MSNDNPFNFGSEDFTSEILCDKCKHKDECYFGLEGSGKPQCDIYIYVDRNRDE
jgi:hypothetical protein